VTVHDIARVGLTLAVPPVTVAVGVSALMWTTGGSMPTVPQFAGFVGLMILVLLAAGTIIPRIGSSGEVDK
jgi:hypothetical protein